MIEINPKSNRIFMKKSPEGSQMFLNVHEMSEMMMRSHLKLNEYADEFKTPIIQEQLLNCPSENTNNGTSLFKRKRGSLPHTRHFISNENPNPLMPMKISNPDLSKLKLYQVTPKPKLESLAQRQKSVMTRNILEERQYNAARDLMPGQTSIQSRSKLLFKNQFSDLAQSKATM